MSTKIALADCDSFFVSCEQLANPQLLNKPVCVTSNNDGCVVARSKEAKQLGIKMGMPVFMAKKEFPGAVYLSGNMALYGEISARVMSKLKDFSPMVEVYSVDEAFLDLTGLRRMYKKNYLEIALDIRNTIREEVGIPVSIGTSSTKVLAKLATERAKKTDGVYDINYRSINDELKRTELLEIWGIGSNTAAFLNKYGIRTPYQLVLLDDNRIVKLLGKRGYELKQELLGNSVYPVSDRYKAPRSIQKTSSFASFTSDENYIKNSLNYHVHRACKKLRQLKLKTKTVNVMLRTKDFRVYLQKAALIEPTDFEFEVFETVKIALPEIYTPQTIYRSSGIILEDLSEETQLSIFSSSADSARHKKLTQAWDALENRFGRGIISKTSAARTFY